MNKFEKFSGKSQLDTKMLTKTTAGSSRPLTGFGMDAVSSKRSRPLTGFYSGD